MDARENGRRRWTGAALSCLASLVLALAGASLSSAQIQTPYEIDVILSLTGSGAALGKAEAESIQLLQSRVNRSGGVRGRPIAFVIRDDRSSPQVAVQLAGELG